MALVSVVILVIGAILGTLLRFKLFLRGALVVGAGMVILAAFRGLESFVISFWTALLFIILLLAGAAIGRTLKQAFLEG